MITKASCNLTTVQPDSDTLEIIGAQGGYEYIVGVENADTKNAIMLAEFRHHMSEAPDATVEFNPHQQTLTVKVPKGISVIVQKTVVVF